MSVTNLLVPSFTQMLRALSAWLDKAVAQEEASGREPDGLLSLRIAPDMYPLASQIYFVCFQAQEAVYCLRGEPVPDALAQVRQQGWRANEHVGTLADARARIAEALAFLGGLAPDALDQGAEQQISLGLPNGMIIDMEGEQYVRDWALPQFYFHLTTAYALMRGHGVALGKGDFVAHTLAYVRPGTMPAG